MQKPFKNMPVGMPIIQQPQVPKPEIHKLDEIEVFYINKNVIDKYYFNEGVKITKTVGPLFENKEVEGLNLVIHQGMLNIGNSENKLLTHIPINRVVSFDFHWLKDENNKSILTGASIIVES